MAAPIPQLGQTEEAAQKLDDVVSAESLRDTQAGSPPEPRAGMQFTYTSGSRPLDGYTIKRGVGRGGFGEVYYATSDAGKEVALKLVRRNLEIELRGMTQCLNLKHPNLISLYDIRQDGREAYWVVMEYVAGESLEQILAHHPDGLPPGEAVACMKQVCAGVAYLHDRGIVHRDLKPGNIFLDEGTYKIGDYGLSKFISHSRRSGQTESIGTVHYMAPEIANGRYGKEIDTYALGVMFYEMLTGHVPFEGESIGEVLMKHLTAEPDLARVPAPFKPIVARLLRKDPDQRYANVPALMEDIDAALTGKPLAVADAASVRPAQEQPVAARIVAGRPAQPAAAACPKRLRASSQDQVLSGVCAGFANYFGIDPIWVRLAVVLVTVLASGIPILLYFVLAIIMPSDEEEHAGEAAAASTAGFAMDSAQLRDLSLDALRVLIALFVAGGVGCLTGAISIGIFGWHNDAVNVIPFSAGFLAASVGIACITKTGHPLVRGLCVLLFAIGGALGVIALCMLNSMRDDEAILLGVGTGLLTAAIGFTFAYFRLVLIAWRLLTPLLAGVGSGLFSAAIVMIVTNSDEMAAFLGVGTGFMVCALTAYTLFFGFLSPVRQRARVAAAARQLADGSAPPAAGSSKIATRILVAIAVVIGLIPVTLFVIASTPYVQHHSCEAPNCVNQATRVFTRQAFKDGNTYSSHQYCDVHAQQSGWEARSQGVNYRLFDINTGHELNFTMESSTDESVPSKFPFKSSDSARQPVQSR